MKKTKIICTMGPSTDNVELLVNMIKAGMDCARFNFSHGNHEDHGKRLALLREAAQIADKPVAALCDTKGPEMRLGIFAEDKILLASGDRFVLTTEEMTGTKEKSFVNYAGLPEEVKMGDTILLNDGIITLEVVNVAGKEIETKVINGGYISSRKRVACPGLQLSLPFLSEQDKSDILFAASQGMDYIAASFVQKAEDVLEIRKVLEANGYSMGIISKIENQAGVNNIEGILAVSDGIMVARGDLGVEIPAEDVPVVQKDIIARCNTEGKIVVTATQMLESMCNSYRATRAEVNDVANAIYDGSDVVMLSGETASGQYPLEAVKTMARICTRTEHALHYDEMFRKKGLVWNTHFTDAISHATCQIALEIDADAIVCNTESGFTARMVAKYRPNCEIIAVSTQIAKVRAMQLYWGVYPILGREELSTDGIIDMSISLAMEKEIIRQGDCVIVTAGVPVGTTGSTNLIKVVNVGKLLAKGIGIGKRSVNGTVAVAASCCDCLHNITKGSIVIVSDLEEELIPYITENAAAIIAEEGGLTSNAAMVAVTTGIPVIVDIPKATTLFKNGQTVTVDAITGCIYEGIVKV
ncbi:MAG: pyruvate kinase [Phascolarctobacterium sp.]|nr:pyruvate kinase [Phascolarctobacterium sp.]